MLFNPSAALWVCRLPSGLLALKVRLLRPVRVDMNAQLESGSMLYLHHQIDSVGWML